MALFRRQPAEPLSTPEVVAELREVHVEFEGRHVLNGISMAVRQGDRVIITGPSGSGKTTVIRTLQGLEVPQSGEVYMLGERVNPDRRGRVAQVVPSVMRRVGLVPQRPALIETHSPLTNIGLLAAAQGKRLDYARVYELAQGIGLNPEMLYARRTTESLSGGEKTRVALLRALVVEPELLLLDEPSSTLDPDNRQLFNEQLTAVCEANNTSVIMVTHDPDSLDGFPTRHLVMEEGVMIERPLIASE